MTLFPTEQTLPRSLEWRQFVRLGSYLSSFYTLKIKSPNTLMHYSDPFAWSNETGSTRVLSSQTTTATSGSCYAYPVPSTLDQANTQYQSSSVSPQLTRTINAAHYAIGQSQFPSASTQVSPSAGPGGMRYSPSHAQASRSLPQMQYSPHFSTHAQAHLGASQCPLSPVQTAIANARYSPSHEEISYEYTPTPDFISSLFAATRDPAVGNITTSNNALVHASPETQAGRTGTTDLSSRSLSGGTHDVTEKHRSFIVHNVSLDTTHRSIVMMFPVSCNTDLVMGDIQADIIRLMNILPSRMFASRNSRLRACSHFLSATFERPSTP